MAATRFSFLWLLIFSAILASILCFDLFIHPDRSITFDGRVHISTIAQYKEVLFTSPLILPIIWVDYWGNYGYPLGLISTQTTSYFGAILAFFTNSPVLAYNLLFWLATFFCTILSYIWLRFYVSHAASLLGTLFLIFAPYHIQNIYVRGALPEYTASVFILLILYGIEVLRLRRYFISTLALIIGTFFLSLTHPMMLVTGFIFLAPYSLIRLLPISKRLFLPLILSCVLGFLLSSYYLLPLTSELKYFYYGNTLDKLRPAEFLSLPSLLSPFSPYFGSSHPGPPAVALRLGFPESIALSLALILFLKNPLRFSKSYLAMFTLIIFLIFFTHPLSLWFYSHLSFLNNLQYPWRFLSVVSLLLPLAIAMLFNRYPSRTLFLSLVILILFTRIPQSYGKNYIITPPSEYSFTLTNLHTKNMAPIWAGESASYPREPQKVGLIGGEGKISNLKITNSTRSYTIEVTRGPAHLVDYTFFFQGWKVYVDGVETPIEFQDPNYRGVLTYFVPVGKHDVIVRFIPTRVRKYGLVLSGLTVLVSIFWLLVLWKLPSKSTLKTSDS